jgi:hypothetical protein
MLTALNPTRAIHGSLICLVCALCAACSTSTLHRPSTYVPLDPVFKEEITRIGTMPILLFPDDPIEAIYDKSQVLSKFPDTGDPFEWLVSGLLNLGVDAINSSVIEGRKREAYQTALPVIEELSSYDLKADVAHAIAAEMKDVQWLNLKAPIAIPQKTMIDRENKDRNKFGTYSEFLSSILPPDRPETFYLSVFFKQVVKTNYVIFVRYQILSKDYGVAVFRNDAMLICPSPSAQDWVSWWSTNDGQRLRAAYTKGVHALAALLAFDLGIRNALDDKVSVARTLTGNLIARCPEEWWK